MVGLTAASYSCKLPTVNWNIYGQFENLSTFESFFLSFLVSSDAFNMPHLLSSEYRSLWKILAIYYIFHFSYEYVELEMEWILIIIGSSICIYGVKILELRIIQCENIWITYWQTVA